jgi:hypothetical protein
LIDCGLLFFLFFLLFYAPAFSFWDDRFTFSLSLQNIKLYFYDMHQ